MLNCCLNLLWKILKLHFYYRTELQQTLINSISNGILLVFVDWSSFVMKNAGLLISYLVIEQMCQIQQNWCLVINTDNFFRRSYKEFTGLGVIFLQEMRGTSTGPKTSFKRVAIIRIQRTKPFHHWSSSTLITYVIPGSIERSRKF